VICGESVFENVIELIVNVYLTVGIKETDGHGNKGLRYRIAIIISAILTYLLAFYTFIRDLNNVIYGLTAGGKIFTYFIKHKKTPPSFLNCSIGIVNFQVVLKKIITAYHNSEKKIITEAIMTTTSLYNDIAVRTSGDIYIGVVGPVRTGKSTFIKRFMETAVIPNIRDGYKRDRALDELPQSASGRTIMTAEPKFIPEQAAEMTLDGNVTFKARLIDCVGYIVDGALGYIENEYPRMVRTPWFEEDVPFNMAAEIGTRKVISEHSTIGIAVTTDGTVCELPREEYIEAEQRVISELKNIGKPFVVILNSAHPNAPETVALARELEEKYDVCVMAEDCLTLDSDGICRILEKVLMQFPVSEIRIAVPSWLYSLDNSNPVKASVWADVMQAAKGVRKLRDTDALTRALEANEYTESARTVGTELGKGCAEIAVTLPQTLFYKVLAEETGVGIADDGDLIKLVTELSAAKQNYGKFAAAMTQADAKGYGIVTPTVEELSLEEPEIVKQGSRFGVRLKASAPSYHIIKADIETEVSPVVGSEKQSEELVRFLLTEFEEDPKRIWESDIFGKSLNELVNEGLNTKLNRMPDEAREKMRQTLERVINEGSGGLICIIL